MTVPEVALNEFAWAMAAAELAAVRILLAPASAAASAACCRALVAIEHVPDIDSQSCHAEKNHKHDRDQGQYLATFLLEPTADGETGASHWINSVICACRTQPGA